MLFVLFAFLFVGVIPEPLPGKCPNVTLLENIDLNKFLGMWNISHTYVSNKSLFPVCYQLDIKKEDKVYTISSYLLDKHYRKVLLHLGRLDRMIDATNEGQLLLKEFQNGFDILVLRPLYILSTDYTEYAIVYSCTNSNQDTLDFHEAWFWILTKQQDKLEGVRLQKVQNAFLKYINLTENKISTIKDFPLKDLCVL